MLEYKISIHDTSLVGLVPDNAMRVYTDDTIARMENYSQQLGSQISIRHMEMNKSYLLLTVQDTVHFAIRTNLNDSDTVKTTSRYTFDKKLFGKRYMGFHTKRVMVGHPDFAEPIEFLYIKKYSKKYLNNFDEIPGLLVKYSVPTPDGVMDYSLVGIKNYMPDRNLFGIPADYKKVSFDEFMDYMFPASESGEPQN